MKTRRIDSIIRLSYIIRLNRIKIKSFVILFKAILLYLLISVRAAKLYNNIL